MVFLLVSQRFNQRNKMTRTSVTVTVKRHERDHSKLVFAEHYHTATIICVGVGTYARVGEVLYLTKLFLGSESISV